MKLNIKFTSLLLLISLISTGCETIPKPKKIKLPDFLKIKKEKTIQKLVKINSCKSRNIDELIKNGWSIKSTEEKEIICSWKTKRSKKGCNLKKDKGCAITVPDSKGKEYTYMLEKTIPLN
tara:strand:- start:1588 stop:1950 length:363 start_codon:yes stop_codon:yes gene_type:complete